MPKSKKRTKRKAPPETAASGGPAVRPFWSGTITFGLVSIPVDLLSAVRARQTAMKLIDTEGNALGREYHSAQGGKELELQDLVRGYETEDGKMVEVTDEDIESVAPEMSSDINLRNFVPADEIPPVYFQKPYFLAPAGKSSKAYNLLAATMAKTGRVGIGSFVMRGHEYLVAIVSDNGVLRADTLRYQDEVRTPESIGLPKRSKPDATTVNRFVKEIEELQRDELSMTELEDKDAEALQALVEEKRKDDKNVIHRTDLESEDEEAAPTGQIIDLMEVLRKSLSKRAVVTNATATAPISLAERRAIRDAAKKPALKKKSKAAKSQKRSTSR